MYYHVVLFRLRAGVTLDRVRSARESLAALVETLPGVEHFAVSHNQAADHGGYSLALFAGFENKKACEIFTRHPELQRIETEELGPVVESRVEAAGSDADPRMA